MHPYDLFVPSLCLCLCAFLVSVTVCVFLVPVPVCFPRARACVFFPQVYFWTTSGLASSLSPHGGQPVDSAVFLLPPHAPAKHLLLLTAVSSAAPCCCSRAMPQTMSLLAGMNTAWCWARVLL